MATERLIRVKDAEDAINRIGNQVKTARGMRVAALMSLCGAPTVEAVEVVHGRWIPSKSMALSDKCSVCHGWVTRHSVNERKYRYCPNCGAKMDGDGNERC